MSKLFNHKKYNLVSLYMVRSFIAIICIFCLGYDLTMAQDSRPVTLPIIFHAEGEGIRTTACLQVTERIYPNSAWWDDRDSNAGDADRAFKAVIAAIKRKDRAALYDLSDPVLGRDPKRFDEQASAFFEQLRIIELIAVPRAYEFDGLVVFYAELRYKDKTLFTPFTFTYNADGSVKFLPYRTELVTYNLVDDWFNSKWGPGSAKTPIYCANENIERATHRIPLVANANALDKAQQPGYLLFNAAPVNTTGDFSHLSTQIYSKFEQMNSALSKGVSELIKHMAPEGGKRLKDWFASADEIERGRYKSAVTNQHPFYFIDASPLVVVYTRTSAGRIKVMYFTVSANNDLLWTNSSYITVADKVFKKGPLYNSATLDKPFSNSVIK